MVCICKNFQRASGHFFLLFMDTIVVSTLPNMLCNLHPRGLTCLVALTLVKLLRQPSSFTKFHNSRNEDSLQANKQSVPIELVSELVMDFTEGCNVLYSSDSIGIRPFVPFGSWSQVLQNLIKPYRCVSLDFLAKEINVTSEEVRRFRLFNENLLREQKMSKSKFNPYAK